MRKVERGFTLVELFFVLLIFSLLVVIFSFYFIDFMDRLTLEEASMFLLTNLRLFQESACSQNSDYYDVWEFYPTIELCLWKVYNSSSNSYKIYKKFDLKKYNVDLISANFGSLTSLHFTPIGIPSSGGTVVLGKGNLRKYIIVTPATGRIWISDSPPINW